ncbi:MAG: MBL fold metallo-hydrolase [Patescibacteria group bacterium]|nr:MBL fold metallo-hydrolase [Patescibacteria group bacterium]MDD5121149.1 MBL fold metallo-hydrolase [Patescibacteria group bacterium]MDD5221664.1 MBL fold metallo-hydrolase [Patescibacteria group bacterium]MDD5395932.1 MBL fold metallo-hydrolase [Patescibacteria group bacterium]
MYIYWYGQSSFKIQDKEVTVLLDPYSSRQAGLRGPNFKADITILDSEELSKQAQKDIKEGFLIDSPGEYEVKGVFVLGVKTGSNKIIYQIEVDGVKIGYLGEINKTLNDTELDKVDNIDVLIIPVGDKKNTLGSKEAAEIIREIEPKIVIPSCYQISGLKNELESLDKFLKEIGVKKYDIDDKVRIVKKELPENGMQVMVLKNS